MFKLFQHQYNGERWCFVRETNTAAENACAVKNGSPPIPVTTIISGFAHGHVVARPVKT